MHRDHSIFVRAVMEKRRVKVTLASKWHDGKAHVLCGPIVYNASAAGEHSDYYYFWDFESSTGALLGLPPSQIVGMELTEEPFDLVKYFTSEGQISDS